MNKIKCLFSVQDALEGFAPVTHPRIPQLIIDCVAEIERRGLEEVSFNPDVQSEDGIILSVLRDKLRRTNHTVQI